MYSATSNDEGLTFTMDGGVRMTAALAGASSINGGSVVRTRDSRWRMYFSDLDKVFSASSTDLLTWTLDAGVRVGPGASLGENPAAHPDAIVNADGSVSLYFFHGPSPANPTPKLGGMYVSTSSDGLTFSTETFTGVQFGNDANVVPVPGGGFRMYYNWGDDFGGTIYSATATDPTATIDQSGFFVRQHYLDFLNREPDTSGLNFWINNINNCAPQPSCIDVQRINTSAAFFLSIEFQNTGYLVYRIYKASFGNLSDIPNAPVPIKRQEFLPDTQQIGNAVIVNQGNWQQQLEANKQAFTLEFVQRSRFTGAFPTSMTPAQFIDKLFANAGVTPTTTDRNAAIAEFGSATTTGDVTARSRALRDVAENTTLNTQEFNKAFVLMQYFGYLRRNPYDPPESTLDYSGYNFWLAKLNQFNGNFQNAEMVKAFLSSTEYRQRFGP